MKKIFVTILIISAVTLFTYCSSTKTTTAAVTSKTETKPVVKKINFQDNVMGIMQASCTPCHFPDKGGNKKPLDTYAAVSSQVDEVLRRIQLAPGERGYMPRGNPKLSDSTINVIRQWKADGLTDK